MLKYQRDLNYFGYKEIEESLINRKKKIQLPLNQEVEYNSQERFQIVLFFGKSVSDLISYKSFPTIPAHCLNIYPKTLLSPNFKLILIWVLAGDFRVLPPSRECVF